MTGNELVILALSISATVGFAAGFVLRSWMSQRRRRRAREEHYTGLYW